MKLVVLALVGVALGCTTSPTTAAPTDDKQRPARAPSSKPKPPVTTETKAMNQPELEWTVTKVGTSLRIDYTITNHSTEKIYVSDQLVEPHGNDNFVPVDRPVVMNVRGAKGLVLIGVGGFSSDRPSAVIYQPTFRPLDPGGVLKRSLDVPLPLKSYNPVGGTDPIPATANQLSLRIIYFAGEPQAWKTMPSKSATPIKVPDGFTAKMLQTPPKPLPM